MLKPYFYFIFHLKGVKRNASSNAIDFNFVNHGETMFKFIF